MPILGTPARAKHCVTFRRLSESGTILVPKTGTHFLETNTQNGKAQSFVYASESSIGPGTMQQISQESFRYLFENISRRPLRTGQMTTLPGFPQLSLMGSLLVPLISAAVFERFPAGSLSWFPPVP